MSNNHKCYNHNELLLEMKKSIEIRKTKFHDYLISSIDKNDEKNERKKITGKTQRNNRLYSYVLIKIYPLAIVEKKKMTETFEHHMATACITL